jgi:hypothetical protein
MKVWLPPSIQDLWKHPSLLPYSNLSLHEPEPHLLLWGDSFCGTFLFLMSFSIVLPWRRLRDGCDFSKPGHLRSKACSLLKIDAPSQLYDQEGISGVSQVMQLHADLGFCV